MAALPHNNYTGIKPLFTTTGCIQNSEVERWWLLEIKQESRDVAGNPRDAAVIFDP